MAKKNTKIETVKKGKSIENQNLIAYMFILPWLIGFLLFTIFPFCYTVYGTFNDISLDVKGWQVEWVGFDNYLTALITNPDFKPLIVDLVTTELTYTPAIIAISFILAVLLNQKIKGKGIFRTIFFLPVIVLSGSAMNQMLNNDIILPFNYSGNFLYRMMNSYVPGIMRLIVGMFENFTMILWFTGIPIILFINGLQKINPNLYEAAKIDGANSWQILWKITVPNVKSTALIASIFTIVQIATIGGGSTLLGIISDSIYQNGIGYGIASTFAWLYTLVVFIFIGIAFLLFGREKKVKSKKLTSIQQEKLEAVFEKRRAREEGRL